MMNVCRGFFEVALILCLTLSTASSAGAAPKKDIVTFALVTDSHITWSKGKSTECFKAIIEDINSRPVDFVVHAGDEGNIGSTDQFNLTKKMMDALIVPYYAIPGNHDGTWSESGGAEFAKVFGRDHFCFNCKGWRFVGCPSGPQAHMVKPCLVPRESLQWIESLKPDAHSIFFMHCPANAGVYNSAEFLELIRSKGATFLLGGHTHKNHAYDYDGLPGAVCRNTQRSREYPEIGYSIVRIGNNVLTISECVKGERGFYEKEPWYSVELKPGESIKPASPLGLPTSTCTEYTSLTPGADEVWRSLDNANIISGSAVDVAGDRFFYGNTAGEVKCLRLSDGQVIWTYRMKDKIFSVPAYEDGVVVIGCTTGEIVGLDAGKGKKLWSVMTQNSLVASPVIHKGVAYMGASDKVFRAIDIKKGKIVWTSGEVTGFVQRALYVDDEQLVVADWNRTVYSFEPKTGKLQWKWLEKKRKMMFSAGGSTIVKADGKIFFSTPHNSLFALDAKTGEPLWKQDIARESLGLSEDGGTLYAKSEKDTVSAVSVAEYTRKWSIKLHLGTDTCRSRIECHSGLVYVPTFRGFVFVLDGEDGAVVKKYTVASTALNPIHIIPGIGILATSIDGYVALLKL